MNGREIEGQKISRGGKGNEENVVQTDEKDWKWHPFSVTLRRNFLHKN